MDWIPFLLSNLVGILSLVFTVIVFLYAQRSDRKIKAEMVENKRIERVTEQIRQYRTALTQLKNHVPKLNEESYQESFVTTLVQMTMSIKRLEESNQDIDLVREANEIKGTLDKIASIYERTFKRINGEKEVKQDTTFTIGRQKLRLSLSQDHELLSLIEKGYSDTTAWLTGHT